jgi:hypothetical protein
MDIDMDTGMGMDVGAGMDMGMGMDVPMSAYSAGGQMEEVKQMSVDPDPSPTSYGAAAQHEVLYDWNSCVLTPPLEGSEYEGDATRLMKIAKLDDLIGEDQIREYLISQGVDADHSDSLGFWQKEVPATPTPSSFGGGGGGVDAGFEFSVPRSALTGYCPEFVKGIRESDVEADALPTRTVIKAGQSLDTIIKKYEFTGDGLLALVLKTFQDIKELSGYHICHGDLHAGNVLVNLSDEEKERKLVFKTKDVKVKIIDFGRSFVLPDPDKQGSSTAFEAYRRIYCKINSFHETGVLYAPELYLMCHEKYDLDRVFLKPEQTAAGKSLLDWQTQVLSEGIEAYLYANVDRTNLYMLCKSLLAHEIVSKVDAKERPRVAQVLLPLFHQATLLLPEHRPSIDEAIVRVQQALVQAKSQRRQGRGGFMGAQARAPRGAPAQGRGQRARGRGRARQLQDDQLRRQQRIQAWLNELGIADAAV